MGYRKIRPVLQYVLSRKITYHVLILFYSFRDDREFCQIFHYYAKTNCENEEFRMYSKHKQNTF